MTERFLPDESMVLCAEDGDDADLPCEIEPRAPEPRVDWRSLLRASAFAPFLADGELQRLEREMVRRRLPAGGSVFARGAPALHWFLVVDGTVKVEAASADGRVTTLNCIGRGGWFGEASLLDRCDWPYDATAVTPTLLALLPRASFERLLDSNLAFNRFLLGQLNARLRQFVRRCEHLRFCSASQHVAHCLAELFDARLYPCADAQVRLSQEEVAHLAGISRPTVNRALRELEALGVLRVAYGTITVRDTAALQRHGSLH